MLGASKHVDTSPGSLATTTAPTPRGALVNYTFVTKGPPTFVTKSGQS